MAGLGRRTYEARLTELQHRLNAVQQAIVRDGLRAIVVFEGWDAAGKGGIIRRIAWCLDPRTLRVWATTAPTERERREIWLQRFWEKSPRIGEIAVFDRSWYGRVLVERVEGYASEQEWRRAYDEIAGFEQALTAEGCRIVKLFLDIDPAEQLERFRARWTTPRKRWKLTEEDLRNRARRVDYEAAYAEMIERTSTDASPWVHIDANDKRQARIDCLGQIVKVLGAGLDTSPPEPPAAVRAFFEADRRD